MIQSYKYFGTNHFVSPSLPKSVSNFLSLSFFDLIKFWYDFGQVFKEIRLEKVGRKNLNRGACLHNINAQIVHPLMKYQEWVLDKKTSLEIVGPEGLEPPTNRL